jgi:peroxiredoxin
MSNVSGVDRLRYGGLLLVLCLCADPSCWAQQQEKAPYFTGDVWFNAGAYKKAPTLKVLRGKVVLLFFWTLEDPNCEAAAVNLNHWYLKYRRLGLEIVGVHTPEWEFNRSQTELFKKIDALKILFPVVVDDDSAIRSVYGQQAWPSYCLIDRDGYIRARYDGLYSFSDMQKMLEALLEESGRQPRLRRATREAT